jgi:hypothetical protein
MNAMSKNEETFDAWNPGLNSEIPGRLLPLVTLYRKENSDTDYPTAKEASEFWGLETQKVVVFKVSRLVVHELLIRVTSDLYVPDGPSYEELGINLRNMVGTILNEYIQPRMNELEQKFDDFRQDVEQKISTIIDSDIYNRTSAPSPKENAPFFARFFRKETKPIQTELPEILALADWQKNVSAGKDALDLACYESLLVLVGSMVGKRGRLIADKDMICRFAANLICNNYGSQLIGKWIEPMIADAVKAEGYRFLPYQKSPFFMNVKGASAAGKSTIRPLQRKLSERLNIPWEDFALVSPDYWRKFLLDYDSLGDDFKYAAMLTGQELEIIDKKLDKHMATKAAKSEMPHLLIDRFRFDSFTPSQNRQKESTLISRFGDTVYLFFVITSPSETVERAWARGGKTGRYKAVDDLLFHNIEAYTGMPQLFFSWVTTTKQKIHFEFLDNDVPLGMLPRTVAFGWNDKITILDMECMQRINHFQNINIEAQRPEDVFLKDEKPEGDFIKTCVDKIKSVTFADYKTAEIYGQITDGKWVYKSNKLSGNPDLNLDDLQLTKEVSVKAHSQNKDDSAEKMNISDEKKFTVGSWG